MILTSLKLLAVLLVIAFTTALVLFRVDEVRSSYSLVPVVTVRGSRIVKVIFHSSIAGLIRRFTGGRLYAITFWNRIYVTSNYLVPSGVQHELEHVKQWYRLGPIRFPLQYAYDMLRFGYAGHPLEISARRASGEIPWLR